MTHRAIPPIVLLLVALGSAPPAVRAGERPDLGAIRRLLEAESPSARAAALRRLAGQEDRGAQKLLLEGLADPHPYVRRAAAGVLGTGEETGRASLLRSLTRLREPRARVAACRVLALWADARGRRALLDQLAGPDPAVRAAAVRWLADDEGAEVTDALRERLADWEGEVRALAVDALVARGADDVVVESLLADRDWRVRLSAVEGSVVGTPPLQGGGKAVVALLHGLDDAVWSVRFLAAELSQAVPDARLLPPLVRTLRDSRQRVATAAHGSLVALTGIPFDPDPAIWEGWLTTDGLDFDPATREPARAGGPRPPGGRGTVARARFLGLAIESGHVAFVLDGSGSMSRRLADGRSRWDEARAALERTLASMGPVTGNVFVFRNAVEAAFPEAVRLTKGRRRKLGTWVAGIQPGGRTALFDGLAAALADPETDTIVLLSDGAPSAGEFFTKTDLLKEVKRLNRWRRARIDVISIGTEGLAKRWRGALRTLASESGGTWISR